MNLLTGGERDSLTISWRLQLDGITIYWICSFGEIGGEILKIHKCEDGEFYYKELILEDFTLLGKSENES